VSPASKRVAAQTRLAPSLSAESARGGINHLVAGLKSCPGQHELQRSCISDISANPEGRFYMGKRRSCRAPRNHNERSHRGKFTRKKRPGMLLCRSPPQRSYTRRRDDRERKERARARSPPDAHPHPTPQWQVERRERITFGRGSNPARAPLFRSAPRLRKSSATDQHACRQSAFVVRIPLSGSDPPHDVRAPFRALMILSFDVCVPLVPRRLSLYVSRDSSA
jgi:hypothetical protein